MEEEMRDKEKKGREGMILLYEKNGIVEYHFEGRVVKVENEKVVNQLVDLGVSHSTTVMVPVEVISEHNEDNDHRLGRIIGVDEISENDTLTESEEEDEEEEYEDEDEKEDDSGQLMNQEKKVDWGNKVRDLLFTLQSLHKDEYPFGFEAFGIADIRGPQGFTLFYSNRIGKFYVKNENVRRKDGDLDLFIRGAVNGPLVVPMFQAVRQPPSAKSVKIIKMTEVVFKGILFTGWHKNKSSGEEKWFGWNDYIGIPKFTSKCARNILRKKSDWDFRLTFSTFTAFFNPTSREWRITELSYSDLEIAKREDQIPCSLFIIDDLVFEVVKNDEGIFKSVGRTREDGSPLRVVVRDENCIFDVKDITVEHAAIVCPVYSNGGLTVSFRALALFKKDIWLNDPHKRELAKQFYTWTAGRHLSETIGQCDTPEIRSF